MSLFVRQAFWIGGMLLAASGPGGVCAWCQYPGQVTKTSKDAPELRAVAVLEWTGDAGKPKASRLVPVSVLDNGQLEDGGVYLARPEPLALAGDVEYVLEKNGEPIGLYDIKDAGQEQGSWVGYGTWKGMPKPKPRHSMSEVARNRIDDDNTDGPVLHRKKHSSDAGGGSAGSGTSSAPTDPDRPTLHRKDGSSDTSGGESGQGNGGVDPDRPTLHKHTNDESSEASNGPTTDPDRPTLKRSKKGKPEDDEAYSEGIAGVTDPDRPRLVRGVANSDKLELKPTLMGLPPDLQQAVAVSDAKTHPEHQWTFSWANPEDEAKMKAAMEDMARAALGLKTPPPPTPRKTGAHRTARAAAPAAPPAPAPLLDENFRVFELAYGTGATMVLSAHSAGPLPKVKFVTLIAQPDLYGNVMVLLKNVTNGDNLDDVPRMRLVDAVDAMADNRGELLFELRGNTMRQFVLYRVLRGEAQKLLVSGGGQFGTEAVN